MRKRTVRKIGNGYFIGLSKWDVKDFELEVGDEIDIEPLMLLSKTKKTPKKSGVVAKATSLKVK